MFHAAAHLILMELLHFAKASVKAEQEEFYHGQDLRNQFMNKIWGTRYQEEAGKEAPEMRMLMVIE